MWSFNGRCDFVVDSKCQHNMSIIISNMYYSDDDDDMRCIRGKGWALHTFVMKTVVGGIIKRIETFLW